MLIWTHPSTPANNSQTVSAILIATQLKCTHQTAQFVSPRFKVLTGVWSLQLRRVSNDNLQNPINPSENITQKETMMLTLLHTKANTCILPRDIDSKLHYTKLTWVYSGWHLNVRFTTDTVIQIRFHIVSPVEHPRSYQPCAGWNKLIRFTKIPVCVVRVDCSVCPLPVRGGIIAG